jgi:hypothetical protein
MLPIAKATTKIRASAGRLCIDLMVKQNELNMSFSYSEKLLMVQVGGCHEGYTQKSLQAIH